MRGGQIVTMLEKGEADAHTVMAAALGSGEVAE